MNIRKTYCFIVICFLGFTVNGQIPEDPMALIPGGEYLMGKNSEQGYDFSPAHKVKIDSFFIDRHEVTNGEYLRFCNETGHRLPEFWGSSVFRSGPDYLNYPVVGVSWGDAKAYAEWAGKRLPTEAEWEYAARGGLVNKEYPNGNNWRKDRAVQSSDQWLNLIESVSKYEPNGYGLFDMGGNVWEWVADSYAADYYRESPDDNPKGPVIGTIKGIRGGSWHSGSMCKKVYFRRGLPVNWCDFAVGFRCAMDLRK
jgi:iron(II)-dependent oxidoreductase